MATTLQGRMRGSRTAKLTEGKPYRRDITETYIVLSDDGTDDEDDVSITPGLPQFGDSWTGANGNSDDSIKCVGLDFTDVDESNRKWLVQVEWSSELPDGSNSGSGSSGTNPPDWSAEVEWDTELEQYTPERDILTSDRILNSAGDPFNPPPAAYRPLITLRYSKYQANWSSAIAGQYTSKVNSDTFLGFTPKQAYMHRITASAHFLFGLQFWRVTYIVRFREATWRLRMPNRGTHYLPGGTGSSKAFLDDGGGQQVGWLDSSGAANSQPSYLNFDIYQAVPFTALLPEAA